MQFHSIKISAKLSCNSIQQELIKHANYNMQKVEKQMVKDFNETTTML